MTNHREKVQPQMKKLHDQIQHFYVSEGASGGASTLWAATWILNKFVLEHSHTPLFIYLLAVLLL